MTAILPLNETSIQTVHIYYSYVYINSSGNLVEDGHLVSVLHIFRYFFKNLFDHFVGLGI